MNVISVISVGNPTPPHPTTHMPHVQVRLAIPLGPTYEAIKGVCLCTHMVITDLSFRELLPSKDKLDKVSPIPYILHPTLGTPWTPNLNPGPSA